MIIYAVRDVAEAVDAVLPVFTELLCQLTRISLCRQLRIQCPDKLNSTKFRLTVSYSHMLTYLLEKPGPNLQSLTNELPLPRKREFIGLTTNQVQ